MDHNYGAVLEEGHNWQGVPSNWTTSIYGCLEDIPDCVYVWSCYPCSVFLEPGPASALNLGDQTGVWSWFKMVVSSANIFGLPMAPNVICDWPCGRRFVQPCWYTSVLDAMVDRYDLPYPEPCGDAGCCEFKWQMVCCGPCTICMIRRELKIREYIRPRLIEPTAPLADGYT